MLPTEKMWAEYLVQFQNNENMSELVPLFEEAIVDPILCQLRPFTSHSTLRLSRCMLFPFSMDCPWAESIYDQEGLYRAFDRYGNELGIGNAKEVIKMLADVIPPHYVPAVEGDMYALKEYTFLEGPSIQDSDLQKIEDWSYLERLNLNKTSITDDGLRFLTRLVNLQQIDSYKNKITDAGLKYLRDLDDLRILKVWGANISGEGFVYLKNLTKLRYLSIPDSTAPKMNLQSLPQLESVESLVLDGTSTTDHELEYIAKMPNLRWVNLVKTKITKDGIGYLKSVNVSLEIQSSLT